MQDVCDPLKARIKNKNKNLRCGCTKAARSKRPNTPGSNPISLINEAAQAQCAIMMMFACAAKLHVWAAHAEACSPAEAS